jgi:F-type H+-transporting ATPase subunit delta
MSIAAAYAKALYEIVKENEVPKGGFEQIEAQMDDFSKLLESSREIQIALLSPITTAVEKAHLVGEFSKKLNFHPLVTQFLSLVAKKGRLSLLQKIRDSFSSVRLTQEGGVSGQLITAEPMGEADIQTLTKAFSQKLGKKVAFRVSIDPLLLAGIKVTVNGVTYDGTLRSQLQKLRDGFVNGFSRGQA